jgi:hypothetical protein
MPTATSNERSIDEENRTMARKKTASKKTNRPLFARKLALGTQILSTGVRGGQAESQAKLQEQTHKAW